jgi:predicted transcriptional regulator
METMTVTKKVPWKKSKEAELELIWKDHIAYLRESKIDLYEEHTLHAIDCNCCTPLSECNRNDEERQPLIIERKMKWSKAIIRYVDRRKVVA